MSHFEKIKYQNCKVKIRSKSAQPKVKVFFPLLKANVANLFIQID